MPPSGSASDVYRFIRACFFLRSGRIQVQLPPDNTDNIETCVAAWQLFRHRVWGLSGLGPREFWGLLFNVFFLHFLVDAAHSAVEGWHQLYDQVFRLDQGVSVSGF